MQRFTWDDLEPAARDAFGIWTSGSDFQWAKEAWTLLTKAGLCDYDTEGERHGVIIRFLALASICRDWCHVVFDETQEDMPGHWIANLEVNPIYVGQLVPDEALPDDPDEAMRNALQLLLNRERSAVVKALRTAYGGDTEGLFVALWRSVNGWLDPEPDDGDDVDKDDADILNEDAEEKVAGYSWVEEGCPSVRPDPESWMS